MSGGLQITTSGGIHGTAAATPSAIAGSGATGTVTIHSGF
jgi:hypothetical protein